MWYLFFFKVNHTCLLELFFQIFTKISITFEDRSTTHLIATPTITPNFHIQLHKYVDPSTHTCIFWPCVSVQIHPCICTWHIMQMQIYFIAKNNQTGNTHITEIKKMNHYRIYDCLKMCHAHTQSCILEGKGGKGTHKELDTCICL